jgi:putative addiction module component (TIGR02574 family)
MSLSQVLEALPEFTVEERQLLIRRAIELDEPPLSEADEKLVDSRLAEHHQNPTSSVPLEDLKERLRSRTKR